MRLVLRGQILVDLDAEGASPVKEHAPRPKLPKKEKIIHRCGRTRESIYPDTYETFINQCTKESLHQGPHIFETKGKQCLSKKSSQRQKRGSLSTPVEKQMVLDLQKST